jgi:hypothetical protein
MTVWLNRGKMIKSDAPMFQKIVTRDGVNAA